MKYKNFMNPNEHHSLILTYKDRNIYDMEHSFARFFERGLKYLRPKIYTMIADQFQLNTSDSENNHDFVNKLNLIQNAYSSQYRNFWKLYIYTLKRGIDKIIAEKEHTEDNLAEDDCPESDFAGNDHLKKSFIEGEVGEFVETNFLERGSAETDYVKGDFVDQYIIVSQKFGLGIQLEWKKNSNISDKPYGLTITSLSPDTIQWAEDDKATFIERYKAAPDKLFIESADPEIVFHTFEWPDDLSRTMHPAMVILDEGHLTRTFEMIYV